METVYSFGDYQIFLLTFERHFISNVTLCGLIDGRTDRQTEGRTDRSIVCYSSPFGGFPQCSCILLVTLYHSAEFSSDVTHISHCTSMAHPSFI